MADLNHEHVRVVLMALGTAAYQAGYEAAHRRVRELDEDATLVRTRNTLTVCTPTDEDALREVQRCLGSLDIRKLLLEHEATKLGRAFGMLSDGFPGGFPSDALVEALYARADADAAAQQERGGTT